MTDLAHAITNTVPTYPGVLAEPGPVQLLDLLPLSGATPGPVTVLITADGSPKFSLPGSSDTYSDGVSWSWSPPKGTSLPPSVDIAFIFSSVPKGPTINSLQSSVTGLTFTNASGAAIATVEVPTPTPTPPVSTTYSFTINHSIGTVDPQIVVTPL